jgi:hypothetical protein
MLCTLILLVGGIKKNPIVYRGGIIGCVPLAWIHHLPFLKGVGLQCSYGISTPYLVHHFTNILEKSQSQQSKSSSRSSKFSSRRIVELKNQNLRSQEPNQRSIRKRRKTNKKLREKRPRMNFLYTTKQKNESKYNMEREKERKN